MENVSKSFGDKKVLESVSLTLEEGEIVCILGASGVGKSTLFHIISGLLMPDEGRVLLDGEDVTGKPGKISYMLQKDMMLPYKTVLDNVALPLIIKKTSGEGKIWRWRRIRTAREKAAAYFEEFGLSGYEKKYRLSCREACVREPRCCGRICFHRRLRCWMSHLVHWILLPRGKCTSGIYQLWKKSICQRCSLPMIWMRQLYCLTGSIFWEGHRL